MKLYLSRDRLVVEVDGQIRGLSPAVTIDDVFRAGDPAGWLQSELKSAKKLDSLPKALAPLRSQEVWAAGVTYLRTRTARIADSKDSGGSSFYDRVYRAERPELFFKATPHRVVGAGDEVRVRRDSQGNVPEPELTLAINSGGKVFGYTIGNDVTARDIEGENPLYLPQAKIYSGSASLGPCVLITNKPLSPTTPILLDIQRGKKIVFSGHTTIDRMKRSFTELTEYLYYDNTFPEGCYLMTGTGIVPPAEFNLQSGDEVLITIPPIGTLTNRVA